MGSIRASTRKKNGYWGRQNIRTNSNLTRKLTRHIANNPDDKVAVKALSGLSSRSK